MASRIHRVEQHKVAVPGIEAMTLVSNHHFPRHSHEQFGVGVIAFGAQRSWSGIGSVSAAAGDVIMLNPGEIHDGTPIDGRARGWQIMYIDPVIIDSSRGKRGVCGPCRDRASCRARPPAGGAFRRTVFMLYSRSARQPCRRRELASLPDVLATAARHGASSAQRPIALCRKGDPAPRFCSRRARISGRISCTLGRKPLPTLAGLRTRSRNHAACIPCSAARAPRAAPSGERAHTCSSSPTGPRPSPDRTLWPAISFKTSRSHCAIRRVAERPTQIVPA